MKRFNVVWIILFCLTFSFETNASVKMEAIYSDSANIFNIMDNVSEWCIGFCEYQFVKYWKSKYNISEDDRKFFAQYKLVREKYYFDPDQKEKDPLVNRNGFFKTIGSVSADPIAESFYSSKSIEEALKKLKDKMQSDDLAFLREFYQHFYLKYSPMLDESQKFYKLLGYVNNNLKRNHIKKYFDEVSFFYGVKENFTYHVLYLWYPPISHTNATTSGNYLLMSYSPTINFKSAREDIDIIFHEVVHTISSYQSLDQKQKLTHQFLDECNIAGKIKKSKILEEPLAVAIGQIEFLIRFDSKRLKIEKSLYSDPWISLFGKMIHPVISSFFKEKKNINQDFVKAAAGLCREVIETSKEIDQL